MASDTPRVLFAIVADTGGAHEAGCVYSLWTSGERAAQELVRLQRDDVPAGCNSGQFHVVTVTIDQSSNDWIGWASRKGG